jgi:NAD(P)-dependent dehydrogenase (short-subunit alcohol dehydrogenase family)
MMNMSTTQKRIAVISGAMGYVGFEVAKKLAQDGMHVAMLYSATAQEIASEKLSTLKGEGHRAYHSDLRNSAEVNKTLELIEKEMGDIYACVHTAGVIPKLKQLHLSSVEDLEEQFDVNVFGSFNFLSACALKIKAHKQGVIVGITTANVVTNVNTKARGAYSVIKFALQGMLVAFKEELGSSNVRVYSVAPGVMPGGMNSVIPKAFVEIVRNSSPTKKLTNASEVADKVSYLCSNESSGVTDFTFLLAPETQTK